jgi:hypothetical protein
MSSRTTDTAVTFRRPFSLSSVERTQPAGTYQVGTDEEQIAGLSFLAYTRLMTLLYLPADATSDATRQIVKVDPAELAAALEQDARDPS